MFYSRKFLIYSVFIFSILLLTRVGSVSADNGALTIVSISPTPRSLANNVNAPISIEFDRAINPATVTPTSFWAFGRWSGVVEGNFFFSADGKTVSLIHPEPLSAGEVVMVILANTIEGADGTPMRSAGYSFQFWTGSQAHDMSFTEIDVMSTRTIPSQRTQAYGGIATDLDNDGWLDLSIINEITADVRVFMNKADGTGLYHDFTQPTFPVNQRASPNEPSDFNRDGNADLAVANINTSSVSILLGNGDGTFAPQQQVNVGSQPRGLAVADVDGDGDTDIINTNSGGSGNMSVLLNDGTGTFGAATFFEGGGNGEWGLSAADMNEDGILDLVIGTNSGEQMIVNTGNGDGTFSFASTQNAGGAVWMIAVGDTDGDGHEDVVSANSFDNNGTRLLGDGNGNLGAPSFVSTDPFHLATDLGDIDGDGDLDWVTSSYSGDWRLFLNDGSGTFNFDREFDAVSAASCALFLDFDNDGDLDLALVDEVADLVHLVRSGPAVPTATTVQSVGVERGVSELPELVEAAEILTLLTLLLCTSFLFIHRYRQR